MDLTWLQHSHCIISWHSGNLTHLCLLNPNLPFFLRGYCSHEKTETEIKPLLFHSSSSTFVFCSLHTYLALAIYDRALYKASKTNLLQCFALWSGIMSLRLVHRKFKTVVLKYLIPFSWGILNLQHTDLTYLRRRRRCRSFATGYSCSLAWVLA